LRADGLLKGIVAEAVGADARLGPPFTAGETYKLTVGSDLIISLPDEPNLRFTITASGQIKSNAPDVELVQDGGTAVGSMGAGEALIEATVGGSAVLRSLSESAGGEDQPFDFDFDFNFDPESLAFLEDLGPMIESSVSNAMAQVDVHLKEGLKYFDSDEFKAKMDRFAEKARHAAERIEQKTEGIAERARKEAERAAERARMRAEQAERRWQRASGQRSAAAPSEPAVPADEKREERLRILHMVEEGKLTADDAAKLLSALG
jgi:hypothetical protein